MMFFDSFTGAENTHRPAKVNAPHQETLSLSGLITHMTYRLVTVLERLFMR